MQMYKNALTESIFTITQDTLGLSKEQTAKIATTLNRILACNKNECELREIITTPCNTLFKYEVFDYTTLFNKIKKLEKTIPLFLNCESVDINFIPEESGFGINIPNINRPIIPLGNLLVSDKYLSTKTDSTCIMGIDDKNEVVLLDFNKVPHMMIAGTTGSGKSTFLNIIISSIIANARLNTIKFVLVDPKMVEFSPFENCTNFLHQPIITSKWETIRMLWDMCDEMDKRYDTFKRNGVKNISDYNKLKASNNEVLPRLIIVIDELGDIMLNGSKKEVEPRLVRLAQKGRAAGINLILATQRPDAHVFTGMLKNCFPMKICFQVPTAVNSRVALDKTGAEKLLGKGDALYTDLNTNTIRRFQSGFVSDEEIAKLIDYIQNRAITEE